METGTPAPTRKKDTVKQYQITYTEDQKTYTVIAEDWRVHQVGDEIKIRIRRSDPPNIQCTTIQCFSYSYG